ncbi:MAG: hypothetical protein AB7S26_37050 [Sandaracinaceae bacterium]
MSAYRVQRIEPGNVAVIAYRLVRDDDGREELLEEATDEQPLVYLHGGDQIAEHLQRAFEGKEVGARFETEVDAVPEKSPRSGGVGCTIPVDTLPEQANIGDKVVLGDDDPIDAWIVAKNAYRARLGFSPPSEESLKLTGRVISVRTATADERRARSATAATVDGEPDESE